MALIQGSRRDVVATFNRQSLATLSYDGLIFSPVVVDELDPSIVTIRATTKESYQYRGTEVVSYRRLRLDDLPGLLLKPPRVNPKETLYELLQDLADALGVKMTQEDVEDSEIVTVDGSYLVDLVAKPDSYGWIGQCTLEFTDLPPLSIPITSTELRW